MFNKIVSTKCRVRGMRAHSPNNPRAPFVLACGFTALRFLSGRLTKLAALTNLSGTNLDAGGARRVSGRDATNQTGKSLILTKNRYSSTQKGTIGVRLTCWVLHLRKCDCWVSQVQPNLSLKYNPSLSSCVLTHPPQYRFNMLK